MSLACCAAIFGSDDATLCGISSGGDGDADLLLGAGAGDALVGAVGATPFEAISGGELVFFRSYGK